jgi:hypothetical protein
VNGRVLAFGRLVEADVAVNVPEGEREIDRVEGETVFVVVEDFRVSAVGGAAVKLDARAVL